MWFLWNNYPCFYKVVQALKNTLTQQAHSWNILFFPKTIIPTLNKDEACCKVKLVRFEPTCKVVTGEHSKDIVETPLTDETEASARLNSDNIAQYSTICFLLWNNFCPSNSMMSIVTTLMRGQWKLQAIFAHVMFTGLKT